MGREDHDDSKMRKTDYFDAIDDVQIKEALPPVWMCWRRPKS